MGKIDNEKFKKLEQEYIPFYAKKLELVDSEPYRFRLDEGLFHQALNLFDMMTNLDETGIYSSNWNRYFLIAHDVTMHIGMSKLRMNHRLWDGDHEFIIGDEVRPQFLREEVVSDEEIRSSIDFLWLAKEYCEKAKMSFRDDDFRLRINQIYHNLDEAYGAIGDEPKQLEVLELASNNLDIRSLESLSRHFIDSENYLPEEVIRVFDLCVRAVKDQIKLQKALGIGTWNDDRKKFEKGAFRLLEIRTQYNFEYLHVTLFAAMVLLVDSLVVHSFYEKGLELGAVIKELCSQLSIWDGRYEEQYDENVSRWNRLKTINEEVVEPTDDVLAPFFSPDTLSKMSSDIKIFMGTSLHVFSCLKKHADFSLDYSPATISLFKAIESILYKMTITELYPYLVMNKERLRRSYGRISASPLIYDRTNDSFHLPETFSIGEGLKILVHKRFDGTKSINTGVKEFLSLHGITDVETKLLRFYNDIENCRVWRNNAAHKERVTKESAEDARGMILETAKIIENAYVNFGSVLE